MDVDETPTTTRESTLDMKRKRQAEEDSPPPNEPCDDVHNLKIRKLLHKKAETRDIPQVRTVQVRFPGSDRSILEAKILYKEPWGVMVGMLEDNDVVGVTKGRRYWAKYSGNVNPLTGTPILDAVHPC